MGRALKKPPHWEAGKAGGESRREGLASALSAATAAGLDALAAGVGQFQFAEAQGEAEGDVAAGVLRGGAGGVVGVDGGGGPLVPVEDVVHVEVERQAALEEVGAHAEVDALAGLVDVEHRPSVAAAVVVARDEDLDLVLHFGPHAAADVPRETFVFDPLAGAHHDAVPAVGEAGVEAYVEEARGAYHGVDAQVEAAAVAGVVGDGYADVAAEEVAPLRVADPAAFVDVGAEGGAGAQGAELGEVFVPVGVEVVDVGGFEERVAGGVAVGGI